MPWSKMSVRRSVIDIPVVCTNRCFCKRNGLLPINRFYWYVFFTHICTSMNGNGETMGTLNVKKNGQCAVLTSLCYTHSKYRNDALIFYIQWKKKTDENYGSKFWNAFLGCCKPPTSMKIPPFDSAWTTMSDTHFLAQKFEFKRKIWTHLTSHDLTLTPN